MSTQLETLPAEIQSLLLCWITDVRDLLSLVGTSSVFLEIYRQNRNIIFTNVVCNQIGDTFLSIALATMRLRNLVEPVDIDAFLGLAKSIEHKQDPVNTSTISIQDVKRLLSSYRFIDKLARAFTKESLSFLRSRLAEIATSPDMLDTDLSPFEHHRVLRGLYNWQMISLISRQDIRTIKINNTVAGLFFDCLKDFLDTLTIHELGEIQFVLHYLRERLSHFMDQAEDDRFEEFIDRGPGLPRFDWEDDGDDMFFSTVLRPLHDDWIRRMLCVHDLHALCNVLTLSTPAARLDFIEASDPPILGRERQNPLMEELHRRQSQLLAFLTSSTAFVDWKVPIKTPLQDRLAQYEESTEDPNLGLLWAHSETQRVPYPDLLNEIAGLGLVIWDKERLRDVNVFTSTNWQFFTHCNKKSFFITRRDKPSVERRAEDQELKWAAQSTVT